MEERDKFGSGGGSAHRGGRRVWFSGWRVIECFVVARPVVEGKQCLVGGVRKHIKHLPTKKAHANK